MRIAETVVLVILVNTLLWSAIVAVLMWVMGS